MATENTEVGPPRVAGRPPVPYRTHLRTLMPLFKKWLNRRPRLDFLVVGAEKAGTTAMFSYLKRVPGVYIPLPKELNFFDRAAWGDGTNFSHLHRWFVLAPKGSILGEATPTYLMNPECFPRIRSYNPDMRIIAILRSPIRRAFSAWNFRRVRYRDKRDFMTAVRVEIESQGDLSVARENKYRYMSAGLYAPQIRALRETFDDEQLLLIKFEDFNRDQETWVRQAARFIGAADDFPFEGTRRPNAWKYKHRLEKDQFNELLPYYEDDISEVEALTGWDCSDWRRYEKTAGTASEEAAEAAAGAGNPNG